MSPNPGNGECLRIETALLYLKRESRNRAVRARLITDRGGHRGLDVMKVMGWGLSAEPAVVDSGESAWQECCA
jgi:hypothetical protein